MEDVETLLKLGVEKVNWNTAAFTDREFLRKLTAKYGSSTIVACIDIKKKIDWGNGVYKCGY